MRKRYNSLGHAEERARACHAEMSPRRRVKIVMRQQHERRKGPRGVLCAGEKAPRYGRIYFTIRFTGH